MTQKMIQNNTKNNPKINPQNTTKNIIKKDSPNDITYNFITTQIHSIQFQH